MIDVTKEEPYAHMPLSNAIFYVIEDGRESNEDSIAITDKVMQELRKFKLIGNKECFRSIYKSEVEKGETKNSGDMDAEG